MTALAPLLQAFFTDRLPRQRHASPDTIAAYRDSFRLLLAFVHQKTGKTPSKLQLEDLDAATIAAFLGHLETTARQQRANPQRTPDRDPLVLPLRRPGSARPSPADRPGARHPRETVRHHPDQLPRQPEIDALLASPDRSTWTGRRDHALLLLAVQTGLRASDSPASAAKTSSSGPPPG